jgi:exosortase A
MTILPKNKEYLIFTGVIFVLFLLAYFDVFTWMVGRFLGPDSYYSHGFIIPMVSGYLIWKKWPLLQTMEPRGTWWGLVLVVCAIMLHLFGTSIYVFSFSGFTIILLVWGIVLFLIGPRFAKTLAFPLFFLVFMLPLPIAVIGKLAFPLKLLVAKAGVWIAALSGIPIHLSGFNVTIPAGDLVVGNPCSGLRSLIAFLAIGSFLAYICNTTRLQKCLLFLLCIPIALVSNMIRIPVLILVSNYYGLETTAPGTWIHTGSGIFVFVLGFSMLYGTARLLERIHAH